METKTALDELSKRVIKALERVPEQDKPYIVAGRQSFTAKELVHEIQNDTDFGRKFVGNLVLLALDLFDRKVEEAKDFKKV